MNNTDRVKELKERGFSKADIKIFKEGCISSHNELLDELRREHVDLEDFWYDWHYGNWVTRVDGVAEEHPTFAEMLVYLDTKAYQDPK